MKITILSTFCKANKLEVANYFKKTFTAWQVSPRAWRNASWQPVTAGTFANPGRPRKRLADLRQRGIRNKGTANRCRHERQCRLSPRGPAQETTPLSPSRISAVKQVATDEAKGSISPPPRDNRSDSRTRPCRLHCSRNFYISPWTFLSLRMKKDHGHFISRPMKFGQQISVLQAARHISRIARRGNLPRFRAE
jgi:hypothetical protein